MKTTLPSPTTCYEVVRLVAETDDYRVYIANSSINPEPLLLKVATSIEKNGLLDREAFVLREIREEIERRNKVFKDAGNGHGLGYQRCFPQLVESFIASSQGNRRINVIALFGTSSMSDIVPLEQWRTREHVWIDPKSSAWIMGRLLKIFTLTHPLGLSVGKIDGGNILVNPIEHHVFLFDWTRATYHQGNLSAEFVRHEISSAACQVFLALGGNLTTGELPLHAHLTDARYGDLLLRMINRDLSDPVSAGVEFYTLVDELWEKGFHPFTTHPPTN
jgi:hypothetical protein